jgi:hypothetical protein
MNRFISKFSILVNLILFSAIFIASIYMPDDPDFGWHLKYGEYFFKTGEVLRDNPLTQLMPDYKWNNSSWLTDLLTYQTFNNFGFIGISILGALVITLTFYFIGKAAKLSLFEKSIIFPIILYFENAVNMVSFRGQLISLLFTAVLFYLLSKYEQNKKIALLLIPFFMLWGNFHGQYIMGYGIFGIWALVYLVKEIYLTYRVNITNLLVDNRFLLAALFISPLAILINPFGIGVYLEALGHFDDPMQKSISEFLAPADFSATWWQLIFCGIAMTIGVLLLGTGKKNLDKAPFYVPSIVLYIFTFWIKRYAWTFYYSAVFLFQPVVHFFEPDDKRQALYSSLVISVLFLLTVVYLKPISVLSSMNWDKYCSGTVNCSKNAAKFVVDNKLNNDKLLTTYDYGGFLIWNYPEIKPTIDGRMHLWRDEKGYSAFEYYYPIEQDTTNDIDATPYKTVLTSTKKPLYRRLIDLHNLNRWKLVYRDNNSAVFVRNSRETN